MLAAATQDTGGAKGRIDAIAVTFSEPVAHPRDAGGSYPFLLSSRTVTSVEPANGTSVQVRVAEAGSPDTGARPTRQVPRRAGLPRRRRRGQPGRRRLRELGGRRPARAHVGDDGRRRLRRPDRRVAASLLGERRARRGERTAVVVRGGRLPGDGRRRRQRHRCLDSASWRARPPDSGATPAVTYTRDSVEDVRDAAGNVTLNSSIAQSTDGARPVLLSVQTGDVDDDGRIDRLASTWSEPLVHADDTSAPFAVSASGFSVARVRAADRRRPRDRPGRAGRVRHRLQADADLRRRRRRASATPVGSSRRSRRGPA